MNTELTYTPTERSASRHIDRLTNQTGMSIDSLNNQIDRKIDNSVEGGQRGIKNGLGVSLSPQCSQDRNKFVFPYVKCFYHLNSCSKSLDGSGENDEAVIETLKRRVVDTMTL